MTPLTLKLFFSDDAKTPVFDSCAPGAAAAQIQDAIKRAEKDAWPGLQKSCSDLADGFFDVRLEDVLLDGWSKLKDFADCVRHSREAPDETCRCHIYDHEVSADYEPRIEVVCEGEVIAKIPLKISLAATVEGLELELRDGKIDAVRAGAIKGHASFAIKDKTLIDRQAGPFPLPGRLDFSDRPADAAPLTEAAAAPEPALA